MRPDSIVAFEATFLASLVLGVVQASLQWQHLTAVASTQFVVGFQCAVLAIVILLILGVSRGRSRWAKRFLVLGFALGIPTTYNLLKHSGVGIQAVLSLMQVSIQAIGLSMLFTASARDWLSSSR